MSEKKFPPAELRFLFLAGGTAFVVTAVCLAAMAAWMVAQKCPGTAAEPLAAAAVGVGSSVCSVSHPELSPKVVHRCALQL